MYCSNCGKEIKEDEKFCQNCGKEIVRDENVKEEVVLEAERVDEVNNNVEADQNLEKQKEEFDNSQANLLCTISVILTYGVGIICCIPGLSILAEITPFCSLAGLVLMIVARVKYPKNIFAKVLMWLYIATVIIYIVLMVAIIIACGIACANFDASSCG